MKCLRCSVTEWIICKTTFVANKLFIYLCYVIIPPASSRPRPGVGRGRVGARGRSDVAQRVKITFQKRLAYLSLANLTLVSERCLCAFSIIYIDTKMCWLLHIAINLYLYSVL